MFALFAGAIAFACASTEGLSNGPTDAGTDAGDTSDVTTPDVFLRDPCEHLRPPPPPTIDDDPTTELPPFAMAVDTLRLLPADGGAPAGFDLDGVCTCDTRPGSFSAGGASCVSSGNPTCDGDGGIDRHLEAALGFAAPLGSDPFQVATQAALAGRKTVLVYVRKYNGRANDREIEVGIARTDGIRTQGCPTSTLGTEGYYTAAFCGDDPWTVPPGALTNGFPALYGIGHVNDFRLVVQLDRAATLSFGESPLQLGSAITVGRLVPLDETLADRDPTRAPATTREKRLWRIADGTIGGRLSASDALGALGGLIAPGGAGKGADGGPQRVCQTVLYLSAATGICGNVDIARSSRFDFSPGYACDAISVGLEFTARPVLPSGEYAAPLLYNECESVDGHPREPSPYVTTYGCASPDGGP